MRVRRSAAAPLLRSQGPGSIQHTEPVPLGGAQPEGAGKSGTPPGNFPPSPIFPPLFVLSQQTTTLSNKQRKRNLHRERISMFVLWRSGTFPLPHLATLLPRWRWGQNAPLAAKP
jgi:hypothetical protein